MYGVGVQAASDGSNRTLPSSWPVASRSSCVGDVARAVAPSREVRLPRVVLPRISRAGARSSPQTCASVVAHRDLAHDERVDVDLLLAGRKPTCRMVPPLRTIEIALFSWPGAPLASMTMSAPPGPIAATSASARPCPGLDHAGRAQARGAVQAASGEVDHGQVDVARYRMPVSTNEPIAPAPMSTTRSPSADPGPARGMQPDGERLGEPGVVEGEPVGHAGEDASPEPRPARPYRRSC